MKQHLAPYYNDPLHQILGKLELDIELTPSPVPFDPWDPEMQPDPVAEQLAMLEESIEGVTVPGPPPPPDLPVATLPPSLAYGGPRSPDPPVPEEALGRDWPGLIAPPAARPFFTHEGMDDRGYHPQLGGSTGIRADSAPLRRWCEERKELVTQETCASCPVEECGYESEQEDEKREPEESERED